MTLFSPKILSSLNSEIDSCALAVTLFVRDFDFLGFLSSFLELLQRYQTIPPIIMVANATWTPSLAFFLSTGIFLCPIKKDLILDIKDSIAFIKIFSPKTPPQNPTKKIYSSRKPIGITRYPASIPNPSLSLYSSTEITFGFLPSPTQKCSSFKGTYGQYSFP
jgi:hypothetical protein